MLLNAIHFHHRIAGKLALQLAVAAFSLFVFTAPVLAQTGGTVTFFDVASNAYGVNDLNSVAISRNNLTTIGGYQFISYYQYVSGTTGNVIVGRRATGSSAWTLSTTPYSLTSTNPIDDHDVIAMVVDGAGKMHLSWGMHNVPLLYSLSNASVLGTTFVPTFTQQTSANNPNLFQPFTSTGVNQVTYPEFYYPLTGGVPNGNLVYSYRNAGASSGGGSGNGNTYWGVINSSGSTTTFNAPTQVLNGSTTSVNGYQNMLTYDNTGNLLMTWTWRGSSAWQTNSNIMFAQSPDNGVTWYRQGGSTPYTLPIIQNTASGGTAAQVGQVIATIPQNSSLINTTGMAVDQNNRPIVATWYAPNSNAGLATSAANNPNRQYMLHYYDGAQWKVSQITRRTQDNTFDTSAASVRDMGRPLVVVDNQNRVLVITRSHDSGLTQFRTAADNNIVVYWNTMDSLNSSRPLPWQSVKLDTAIMGDYEPSFDSTLWKTQNQLDLFYEATGLTGQTTGALKVLHWDAQAYFNTVTPTALFWDANPGSSGVQEGSGTWLTATNNFSNGQNNYLWTNGISQNAVFGGGTGAAGTVTLGQNISLSGLTFHAAAAGTYTLAGGGSSLNFTAAPTVHAYGDATISAPITVASGTFSKRGGGTLTLAGSNTFAGTLQVGFGTCSAGNVNGAVRIASEYALGGVTTIALTDIEGAYSLFQLDGSAGAISIPNSAGITMAGSNTSPGNSLQNIAGNNIINSPVTFFAGGNIYTFQSDAGTLTLNGALILSTPSGTRNLFLRGNGNGIWNGVLLNGPNSNPILVNKTGTGTWTLNGNNTFTGGVALVGGTLALGHSTHWDRAATSPSLAARCNMPQRTRRTMRHASKTAPHRFRSIRTAKQSRTRQ